MKAAGQVMGGKLAAMAVDLDEYKGVLVPEHAMQKVKECVAVMHEVAEILKVGIGVPAQEEIPAEEWEHA